MVKYVLKRLGYLVIVFLIVSLMMFAIYNLIPSDPARTEAEKLRQADRNMTPEQFEAIYQNLREQYGLNDPLIERYARWMGFIPDLPDSQGNAVHNGLLQGNLGYSQFYKIDVIDQIGAPMENTIILNVVDVIITLAITIPLGIFCAVRKRSKIDNAVQVVTIVGNSIPQFIVAIVFIYIFAVLLGWFPVGGAETPGASFDSEFERLLDRLYHMALPVLVMVFSGMAGMTRMVRAAMIDNLSMDYVRTARAKGLNEKVVIYSHAWRNALLPVITSIIGWFLSIFSGSVVIEQTFSLNGMGYLYWVGLRNFDYELVLAMQMFYVVVALIGNLITDLSYGLVDPRVRVNK
ncbi:MAG: ABC transporter permease [Clostridia bacterium]|nr:ABC transporter permease [Clostridia bacterium]